MRIDHRKNKLSDGKSRWNSSVPVLAADIKQSADSQGGFFPCL